MAKVVEGFSFPDDATGEEINAFLAKNKKAPEQKSALSGMPEMRPEMSWPEYAKGLGRSAAAGLTFNFSDEAIAGIRALAEKIPYEQALADEREKKKAFEEQYPKMAFGAEVAGGLPTMLIPGLGPAKVAQSAGRIGRVINAPITQMATAGAKQGALSGLGEAEGDLLDRAKGAVTGGATGALVGGSLYGAGKVAAPVVRAIAERVRPQISENIAKMKILQDLERSGMTPAQAQKEFEYLQSTGAAPSYFDVSPALTSRAEAVAQRPGAAGEGIAQDVAERQKGQRGRIMGQAKERMDQTKAFYETAEDAANALRENAKPLYEKAYEAKLAPQTQYELQEVMDRVNASLPKASKYAEQLFAGEGTAFKQTGTAAISSREFSGLPKLKQYDYIMRGLGQILEKNTNPAGEINEIGGLAKRLRGQIASILDDQVPEFAAARAQYKGDLEVKKALENARKGFSQADPEELARVWPTMSVAEKEAYRAGALKNIRDKVFGSGDFTDATKRVGQAIQDRRDALNIIMPEKASAQLFQDYLEAEAKIAANAQRIKGGSQTARRTELGKDIESGADLSTLGVASDIANSRFGPAMSKVFSIITKSPVVPEKRINAIGEMLRANKPEEVERLTKSLENFVAEQERKAKRVLEKGTKISGQAGRVAGEKVVGEDGGTPPELPPLTIRGPSGF